MNNPSSVVRVLVNALRHSSLGQGNVNMAPPLTTRYLLFFFFLSSVDCYQSGSHTTFCSVIKYSLDLFIFPWIDSLAVFSR